MSLWRYFDYLCPDCDVIFESFEDRYDPPGELPCPTCESGSSRTVSACKTATVWASAAVRGKSDERPPHVMNTEPLADGMSRGEWRKRRKAEYQAERYDKFKRATG